MKEAYFQINTIDHVAADMMMSLKPLIRPNHCPFQPDKSALLVLDMQRQFLDPDAHSFVPSAPAIVPNINRLIASFKRAFRPVIFTRHINTPANAGTMARYWDRLITADSPFSELHSSIDSADSAVLVKTRYDAFIDTPLKNMLLQAGVQCVLITGVMTHICCDTTARAAFQHGFDTYIAVDGTATYNRAFHDASLLNLTHACARPGLSNDFLLALTALNVGQQQDPLIIGYP